MNDEFNDPADNEFGESQEAENENGYRIYRVRPQSSHGLFTVKLDGWPRNPLDPPEFYIPLRAQVEEIINADHDYKEEGRQFIRTFPLELQRENFCWGNYIESMTLKLAIWAADLIRQLDDMARDTCFITHRQNDVYAFHISGCDNYLSVGDNLIATNDERRAKFIGNVQSVSLTEVVAEMPRQFNLRENMKKVRISFKPRWTPFVIQINCLHYTVAELGQAVLFPSRVLQRRPLVRVADPPAWEWHNIQMNRYQREAVLNVLKAENRPVPYLVSGPPGTGKTSTLIEYIHQVYRHLPKSKILVCTPSNTAANVVLSMLIRSRWINLPNDVVRMVSYAHIQSGTLPNNLKRFCGTLPMDSPPSGMKIITELSDLTDYRIVITTVNYSGNFMRMGLFRHFTHLVVDEAGQALETETLIPLSLMQKSTAQIALFGDEKQLGPVVMYNALRKMRFDVSLFERLSLSNLYFDNTQLYSRLLKNYRSVPHLLKFYNELFYQEMLIPMVTETADPEFQMLNRLDHLFPASSSRMRFRGLYFFRVTTPCFKEVATMSWYNPGEKTQVLEFYKKLLENRVRAADIGIVTPYRAQQREITDELDRMNLAKPKVGTVEVFQGDQRMIMLMSPVRSYPDGSRSVKNISLGFVNDPKRINVAISRARALLVIFGNNDVLSGCDHWSKLIRIADSDSTLIR